MPRRPNRRAICIHRSYEVSDLAELLEVSKRTVRRWLEAGLPAIRDRKPMLLLGEDVVAFIAKQAKPKTRCGPGQFFCFRCHEPRLAAFGEAEIAGRSVISLNLRALCELCTGEMYRRVCDGGRGCGVA
jgi:excisionase family DNA binding protein